MNNRTERVRMKAAEYEKKVMNTDKHVTSQPVIHRVISYLLDMAGAETYTTWTTLNMIRYERKRYKGKIKGIRKAWLVGAMTDNQIWEHLEYAQAHRNGLNYHYARHILTQGTRAGGM